MTDDQITAAFVDLERRFAPTPAALAGINDAVRRRRRRMRSTAAISAGLGVCAVVALGAAVAATVSGDSSAPADPASPTSISPTDTAPADQNAAWQEEIRAYKRAIIAQARSHDVFLGGSLKFEDRSLVLYGETAAAPTDVAAMIDEAPDAVTVTWVKASYTMEQLNDAQRVLMAELPDVVSVAITPDFSALQIGIVPQTLEANRPAIEAEAARLTSIPVVLAARNFPKPG